MDVENIKPATDDEEMDDEDEFKLGNQLLELESAERDGKKKSEEMILADMKPVDLGINQKNKEMYSEKLAYKNGSTSSKKHINGGNKAQAPQERKRAHKEKPPGLRSILVENVENTRKIHEKRAGELSNQKIVDKVLDDVYLLVQEDLKKMNKQLKFQLEYDLKNYSKNTLHSWNQNVMKPQIKDELSFEIKRDLNQELAESFRSEIKSEIINEIKNEIWESVNQDVKNTLEKELKQSIRSRMAAYIKKKVDFETKMSEVETPLHLIFVDFNNLWELAQKHTFTRIPDIVHLIRLLHKIISDDEADFDFSTIQGSVFFSKYHECEIAGIKDFQWNEEKKPVLTKMLSKIDWQMVSEKKMNGVHGYRDIDISMAVEATEMIVKNSPNILSVTIVSGDGDFTPVLDLAKKYGIHTIVVAFKKGLSTAMKYHADEVHYMNERV